jgi:PKHD-type hydroxylase
VEHPTVIRGFLAPERVRAFRAALAAARFEDGAVSAGSWARSAKHNKQALPGDVESLAEEVVARLFEHREVNRHAYPHRTTRPLFNRYDEGDHYHAHEDNPLQSGMRADLSYTLFLSEPDDYQGGALCLDGVGASFREPAGDLVIYPTGTLHRVEVVTRGCRLAAVGWIQSVLRDHQQRALLASFSGALATLRERSPEDDVAIAELNRVRNQLMRDWAEI